MTKNDLNKIISALKQGKIISIYWNSADVNDALETQYSIHNDEVIYLRIFSNGNIDDTITVLADLTTNYSFFESWKRFVISTPTFKKITYFIGKENSELSAKLSAKELESL